MLTRVKRFFNTAGPCDPEIHYMLDPLRRVEAVRELIERRSYFVMHAARQVGKSTSLAALGRSLTDEGRYAAVLLSCETGRAYPNDPGAAENTILEIWRRTAAFRLPSTLPPPAWPTSAPGARIAAALTAWAQHCPRPLVVFLDEIDALSGPTLLSVLGQLREGHALRPSGFPWSIGLVGMRDVRDYKVASGGTEQLHTSSPFNVKEASLTMRGFFREEVEELYAEHTADTGQRFETGATDLAFELSQGQPWLVNALARECVDVLAPQRSSAVTREHVREASERLIARQDTHLDSLAERLREPRVRAVLEPILSGQAMPDVPSDDLRFVADLGLVTRDEAGGLAIANRIYQETIPRVLANTTQASLPAISPTWLTTDGRLDSAALLESFLSFWRQHGQPLLTSTPYHEVAPQLVFMAFLHRVVNGNGRLEREYALGRGRMDLLVEYGPQERRERLAIELKVWRDGRKDPKADGLVQLDSYLARLGLDSGWLVVFDQRSGQPPIEERTAVETCATPSGRVALVIRA